MIDASIWRAQQDQKLQLFLAWHTAALAGAAFAGKLPPLKRLLADKPDPRKPKKLQSPVHQLAAMQQWGTLLGLKYGES